MYNNPTNITSGRKVVVQQPIDDRIVFESKTELEGLINTEAPRYYNGLVITVKEFNSDYIWLSVDEAEANANVDETSNLLDSNYTYSSIFEAQYANKEYNFYSKKAGLSNVDWSDITNKPTLFTPSAHTHTVSEVQGLQTELNEKTTVAQAAAAAPVQSVAGKTGNVTVTKADVGLSNVDNTSDVDKPISTATQTALNTKVNSEVGKGLSSNDYTTTEKEKLQGIEDNANNYTLPVATDTTIGGVKRNEGTSGQFVYGIDANGNLLYATPEESGTTGTLSIFLEEDGNNTTAPNFTPTQATQVTYRNGHVWNWNVTWSYAGRLETGGAVIEDLFTLESFPLNNGAITENDKIILSLSDPGLLSDGVTPISNANVGATIDIEDDGANSLEFTPLVDFTRRVIQITPTIPFTKGETYTLDAGPYKRADGATSNPVNISFTVSYFKALQDVIDVALANNWQLPSSNCLDNLEIMYRQLNDIGFLNAVMGKGYFHMFANDSTDDRFGRIDIARPTTNVLEPFRDTVIDQNAIIKSAKGVSRNAVGASTGSGYASNITTNILLPLLTTSFTVGSKFEIITPSPARVVFGTQAGAIFYNRSDGPLFGTSFNQITQNHANGLHSSVSYNLQTGSVERNLGSTLVQSTSSLVFAGSNSRLALLGWNDQLTGVRMREGLEQSNIMSYHFISEDIRTIRLQVQQIIENYLQTLD